MPQGATADPALDATGAEAPDAPGTGGGSPGTATSAQASRRHSSRRHSSRWRFVVVALVVYYALAFAVFARWDSRHWYPVTGDEPHYLVMASGIAHDHTVEQTRPAEQEFAAKKIVPDGLGPKGSIPTPANSHIIVGPHGRYSIHGIGLPLLLAAPYWLGETTGAKLWMIAMSGMVVAAAAYVAVRRFPSRPAALVATIAATAAAPLLTSAAQVYPDIPGGVASLVVLVAYTTFERARRLASDVGLALLLAFQPWLQIKFSLPALIGAVALGGQYTRTRQWRRLGLLVGIVAGSFALLGWYNAYAFGDVTGPYGGLSGNFALDKTALMVFAGLHVDRLQGILVQNPLLVVGLVELVLGVARRRAWALYTAAVYLAFVVPNAMFTNWYGGASFAGRFAMSGGIVLVLPTILGLARLWSWRRAVFGVVVSAGILLQGAFLVEYVSRRFDFYNVWPGIAPSGYPSLYGPVAHLLPALYNSAWAFHFGPNRVALVLGAAAAVAALGWSGYRLVSDRPWRHAPPLGT
ncbi:MAG TPA: hypothetical protein VEI83_14165 [Acidimicrobiales bacterium]|nr:hypothetical protein [Acidimicrobiales bacterium]